MKKIINRKNLILLFLTVLLFLFAGCNGTPPINHAPTITSTPINTATVETLYTYDVNATDSDADILTYALTVNPLGMTINSASGAISWTPTSAQMGDYNVTVEVSDGEFTDTQTFIITVQLTVTVKPVHNITQSTDYTTIQAALNDANSNDIIEVSNGTYNESITLPSGKVITLRSVTSYTFIKGIDGSDTVTCNGSLEGTKLQGFTITHQMGASGTGVSNNNGTLTIAGCSISGNSAPQPGGGIRNYHGTLNITGSNISGNAAITSGGGILNDNGTLTIIGNSIISNNTTDYGGGICNYHGTSTVTGGSIVSENSAAFHGGGITNDHGTLTVTGGSVISENSAVTDGGGIYNDNGTVTITGATVSENFSDSWGGGICNYYGTLTVTGGSAISENSGWFGGGIYNDNGALTITGSIVSENSASNNGGGIYMGHEATLTDIIGGSSSSDTANFNSFINNKKGNTISSAQHIRSYDPGDIHGDFPYNYYTPN